MEIDPKTSRRLEGKKDGFRGRAVGGRLIAYDCERDPDGACRDAEILDAMLAEGAPTDRVERLLVASAGNLPAVLARTVRLQALFAPRRILEMGRRKKALVKAAARHVNCGYAASVGMSSRRLAELAKTLEAIRDALLGGTAAGVVAAKEAILSYGFPAALFFDEDTAIRCLDAGIDDPRLLRLFPRELFALMMESDRLGRERKAALYGTVKPFDSVDCTLERVACRGVLFGKPAAFGDDIMGLSRPCHPGALPERPDYPMAVNARLQRAYADSDFVRWAYVANKMPGHGLVAASFREFGYRPGSRPGGAAIDGIVRLADDGNPAYFKLMLDVSGLEVATVKSVVALLNAGHARSLAYIVREHFNTMGGCLSPEQLLFHSATLGDWDDACVLATAVETAAPGTAAMAVDPFGNTPLWYALYNGNWDDREGCARYFGRLADLGCDPARTNHLGLSAGDLA